MARWTSIWLTATLWCTRLIQASTVAPAPVVVQPSQYWEGADGAWSTFSLRVGSPAQVVRVLVSTAFPNAIAVANSSCPHGPTSSCASNRGGVFSPNASSTWHYRNTFGLYPALNYTTEEEPAYYGLDTIGFGLESSGTTLPNQVVAAVESTDYHLGSLGVNPQATNWTSDFTVQTDSLFKTLRTQNVIPGFTYSYTAGAKYRMKGVLGSLVFGGYDASRVAPQDLVFTMADDVSRDLVIAVQSITAETDRGSTALLPEGVLASIDSTFPYFVLPVDACEAFETQFGLEWNPNAGDGGLYTLTDRQHAALQESNPNITITLANSLSGGPVTNITLPYAAFDLQAAPPLVNATTRYFPLLRAANETQITLGRAFLQEAMLVVDYAQNNFTVWPCVWSADASPHVVALESLSSSNVTIAGSIQKDQPQHSASNVGTGIGVGVGVGVPVLALMTWLLIAHRRHRWPFRTSRQPGHGRGGEILGPELEARPTAAYALAKRFARADPVGPVHEVDDSKRYTELSSFDRDTKFVQDMQHPLELTGKKFADIQHPLELAGSEVASELNSPHQYPSHELPAMPAPPAYFRSRPP